MLAEKDKEIAELEERITDGDKDFEMATSQNERLIKKRSPPKVQAVSGDGEVVRSGMHCESRYI